MSTRIKKSNKMKKKNINEIIKTIAKEKNIQENINNTPTISDSSFFENINFSELFNPNDKFRNVGNKTSFDLSGYNLGVFNSLSTICQNLNISYEKTFNENFNSSNKLDLRKENYNNENIINESDNKENIFTDSIIKMLLSEEKSAKIKSGKSNTKKNNKKNINKEGISLTEEELDELLKDCSPMKVEKDN